MLILTSDPVPWPGHDRPLCLLPPLGRPAHLDLRPAPARTPRLTEDSTVLYQAGTGATGTGRRGEYGRYVTYDQVFEAFATQAVACRALIGVR